MAVPAGTAPNAGTVPASTARLGTLDHPGAGVQVVLSWSGGKDAAFALRELQRDGVEVVELLTTTAATTGRTTMHGVRPELMRRQVDALGYPLRLVELPADASNAAYEDRMAEVTADYADRVDAVAFADLHLEDVRAYREERLADTTLEGYWPLWGRDTDDLFDAVLEAGFEATVVCANDDLGLEFAGRRLDEGFRDALPANVDPCGENGEFHTFVSDGPPFDAPVEFERGERVTREVGDEPFHYVDLRPA